MWRAGPASIDYSSMRHFERVLTMPLLPVPAGSRSTPRPCPCPTRGCVRELLGMAVDADGPRMCCDGRPPEECRSTIADGVTTSPAPGMKCGSDDAERIDVRAWPKPRAPLPPSPIDPLAVSAPSLSSLLPVLSRRPSKVLCAVALSLRSSPLVDGRSKCVSMVQQGRPQVLSAPTPITEAAGLAHHKCNAATLRSVNHTTTRQYSIGCCCRVDVV